MDISSPHPHPSHTHQTAKMIIPNRTALRSNSLNHPLTTSIHAMLRAPSEKITQLRSHSLSHSILDAHISSPHSHISSSHLANRKMHSTHEFIHSADIFDVHFSSLRYHTHQHHQFNHPTPKPQNTPKSL